MKLLLTGAFSYSPEQLEALRRLGPDIVFARDEREDIRESPGIDISEIDGAVCNALFLHNDIGDFTRLKYIQLTSAGLDRAPMDDIRARGILLHSARDVYSIPMAEWAACKVLEIYKESGRFRDSQRARRWEKSRSILELYGKTVCVIGVGSAGKETAKRFRAFGCRIVGVDRSEAELEGIKKSGITDELFPADELDEALGKSDIIVLTAPLTEQTRGLLNEARFGAIKKGSVLVNLSRGELIDENALIGAVKEGRFLGVALDVFNEEPLPRESPLWHLPNVLVTPHNSFMSDGVGNRIFELIHRNLKRYLSA